MSDFKGDDWALSQTNTEADKNLDIHASVLDLYPQFQAINVQTLILGGNFGPTIIGNDGKMEAGIISNNVNQKSDPQDLQHHSQFQNNFQYDNHTTNIFASDDNTKQWFFALNHVRKETFIIAVSIFGGNSSRFVTAASDVLYEYLAPKQEGTDQAADTPKPKSLFDSDPDDLLATTQTVRAYTLFNTSSGRVSTEIIKFKDDRAQSRILNLICGDYRFIKIYDKLTEWLKQFIESNNTVLKRLGSFEPELARTQAAIAIGVLAQREYKHYLDTVIQRWAMSDDSLLRFTVGWVLLGLVANPKQDRSSQLPISNDVIASRREVTIWDKVHSNADIRESTYLDNVINLLKHWITLNNPYLQWTAAISASRIGLIAPDRILKIIRPAAKSPYLSVREALHLSLGLLYLYHSDYARKVISTLAEWAGDSDERVQDTACKEFIILVRGRFDTSDDVGPQVDELRLKTASGKQKVSLDIWELLGIESNQSNPTDNIIFSAVYTLLVRSLSHRSARFADTVCDSIVHWMIKTDKSKNRDAIEVLVQLLRRVQSDSTLAPYIADCLASPKLVGNSVANQLRHP